MKTHIKLLAILFISSFLLFSCSEDDEGTNPVNDNGSNTTIKGRVTDNNGYGNGLEKVSASVEGALVTTAEIQSDGSLQTTSEAEVTTDANGEFEVVTNSGGKSNVVVVATKGSSQWKAIISSEIELDKQNTCPPLNNETTAEADVYAEIVAEGKANSVSYHDVAFYIDGDIAARIKADANEKTEVKNAIIIEAEARRSSATNSYYGYSNNEYKEAETVKEDSQEDFENDLYLSNDSEASYNTAWEAYFNSIVNGYSSTTIEMSHYAEINEIAGKAMVNLNAELNSETQFQLKKRNAYLKAKLIAEAVLNEYEKAGADEHQKQNVADENDNLLLSIKSSTTGSDINDAYADYNSAIKADLKTTFDVYAVAFTSVETTIETTLKASLETAVEAATSTQAIITAYTNFYGSIHTSVSSELSISNNTQLEAFANIYALIYMHN